MAEFILGDTDSPDPGPPEISISTTVSWGRVVPSRRGLQGREGSLSESPVFRLSLRRRFWVPTAPKGRAGCPGTCECPVRNITSVCRHGLSPGLCRRGHRCTSRLRGSHGSRSYPIRRPLHPGTTDPPAVLVAGPVTTETAGRNDGLACDTDPCQAGDGAVDMDCDRRTP